LNRRSDISIESTYIRFTVELNIPGYPDDDGDGLARNAEMGIRRGLARVMPDSAQIAIQETTE